MKFPKRLLAAGLIALTGLGTAQADFSAVQVDTSRIPTAAPKSAPDDIYIVQMKGDPVVAYQGDISGYQATKPGKGQKINPNSAHVRKYAGLLAKEQDQAIRSVNAEKVYNYRYAFNGFAARMTAAEAEALSKRDDVLNIWKDEIRQLQTDGSPDYIGLTEGGEAWSKGLTGENVVIGVIDTGVWPEHPSFADVATPKKGNMGPDISYGPPPSGFASSGCDFGNTASNPADASFSCNNKLLTARCYNSGFSSDSDADNPCGGNGADTHPSEFQSARDFNGHGSHTASTAGGNNGVPAEIGGEFLGLVSGIAPRARIAAYKICWDGPDPSSDLDDGCASSDSAAAIDQAVLDGVDVINYSIGGPSNYFASAPDIAFLFAADAGVFVATSNGNAGPGSGTVGTPSGVPWITAVGATQDDGTYYNTLVVNSPSGVAGEYVAREGASDVTLADTGPITADVTLVSDFLACGPIDPIDGIALASRGVCAFSDKYNNAAAAGASAIVVFNDGLNATRIDPIVMSAPGTTIPGVMIGHFDGLALAGASGVNATLDAANAVTAQNRIADFSSRGPNNGALDIIKPDLSAPGVSILAADTPAAAGELFQSINGTSMASPHVAGSFALLKQAYPDWTPAMARSALMTTARQDLLKQFGDMPADPFDIGAGEILPSYATDPGLAYDAGFLDYLAVLCTTTPVIFANPAATCAFLESIGFSLDPSELNLPSIGIGELVGTQTVTRTVTAVYNNSGKKTFHVSVDAPPGVDVSVSPSTLKLGKDESASYEVTFSTTSAALLDEWAFGSLTWADDDGNYSVYSPIAVRPVAFSTVAEVDTTGTDGTVEIPVQFGYTGPYTPVLRGIQESIDIIDSVGTGDTLDAFCIDLPAHTQFRFATFDADTAPLGADLDLRLFYRGDGCAGVNPLVSFGSSGGATSEEVIDVANPPAGGYFVVIDYYSSSTDTIDYTAWIQPVLGDNGNASISAAPPSAVAGASETVTVDYAGLAPDTRHLGVVLHEDAGGEIARTIIDIDAQ